MLGCLCLLFNNSHPASNDMRIFCVIMLLLATVSHCSGDITPLSGNLYGQGEVSARYVNLQQRERVNTSSSLMVVDGTSASGGTGGTTGGGIGRASWSGSISASRIAGRGPSADSYRISVSVFAHTEVFEHNLEEDPKMLDPGWAVVPELSYANAWVEGSFSFRVADPEFGEWRLAGKPQGLYIQDSYGNEISVGEPMRTGDYRLTFYASYLPASDIVIEVPAPLGPTIPLGDTYLGFNFDERTKYNLVVVPAPTTLRAKLAYAPSGSFGDPLAMRLGILAFDGTVLARSDSGSGSESVSANVQPGFYYIAAVNKSPDAYFPDVLLQVSSDCGPWTQRAVSPRNDSNFIQATYLPTTGEFITQGGYDLVGTTPVQVQYRALDTWAWNGESWRHVAPPRDWYEAREGAVLGFDPISMRLMGFSGSESDASMRWNGFNWNLSYNSSGLPPFYLAGTTTHHGMQRLLLWGIRYSGYTDRHFYGWTGTNWELIGDLPGSDPDGVAVTYDSARDRLVACVQAPPFIETWEWDQTSWTLKSTSGPSDRRHPALWYDAAQQKVVLFGGSRSVYDGFGGYTSIYLNDTWEWNGTSWSQRFFSSMPSPRSSSSVGYDTSRQVGVLIGGVQGSSTPGVALPAPLSGYVHDVWNYSPQSGWSIVDGADPRPRSVAAAAYDPVQRRTLVLEGLTDLGTGNGPSSELWSWDGVVWKYLGRGISAFGAYEGQSAAWTDFGFMAFGGVGQVSGSTFWPVTLSRWDPSSGWGTYSVLAPYERARRRNAGMVFRPSDRRCVVFGGSGPSSSALGDTWVFSLASYSWSELLTPGPTARSKHAMTYDAARDRVVVFGGIDAAGARLGDTWELAGDTWTRISTGGPLPRDGARMVYDDVQQRVLMFGGQTDHAITNELWQWDGHMWTLLPMIAPPARRDHVMAFDSHRATIVVFGGHDGANLLSDTWEMSQPELPTISTQPVSQEVQATQTVQLTVASGSTGQISYQWFKGAAALEDDGRISGVRTQTLVITQARPEDSGSYICVLSSSCGTVVSDVATVTIAPLPCAGDADANGVVNFADITSVLSNFGAVYTPPAVGPGDADGDGTVNFSDITRVLARFGQTCL